MRMKGEIRYGLNWNFVITAAPAIILINNEMWKLAIGYTVVVALILWPTATIPVIYGIYKWNKKR